jgi:hypothetical protein
MYILTTAYNMSISDSKEADDCLRTSNFFVLLLLNVEQFIIVCFESAMTESFSLYLPCTRLIHNISLGDDMTGAKEKKTL